MTRPSAAAISGSPTLRAQTAMPTTTAPRTVTSIQRPNSASARNRPKLTPRLGTKVEVEPAPVDWHRRVLADRMQGSDRQRSAIAMK